MATIEQLEIEIKSNTDSAISGIDALSNSLNKLKGITSGGISSLNTLSNQLSSLNTALASLSGNNITKLSLLASSLSKLSSVGKIELSSTLAKNITAVSNAAVTSDFSGLTKLNEALKGLSDFSAKGFSNAISSIKSIPKVFKELNAIDMEAFTNKINELAKALEPLVVKVNTLGTAFSKLPSNISNVISGIDKMAKSSKESSVSLAKTGEKLTLISIPRKLIGGFTELYSKLELFWKALKGTASAFNSFIQPAMSYVENLNLFTVAMGEYAAKAQEYAETVSEAVGIDPSEFMRNQGTFNTIISGFGVASDKAALMAQNLTQLGYDISSFYNIDFENAMQKLQSGISGELEPLRRLGYDLSVARLQQEAYALGINKSISSMTQAEKSQLRYYAIMTQVTDAQGDMARTLNAPANQLRILQAQVTMAARAFGNIFLPVLSAVIPYLIAVAKLVRYLASCVATLFGFKLADYTAAFEDTSAAVGGVADSANDAASGLGNATKAAEELKNATTGIDELNIISPNDAAATGGSGGSGSGGAGGGLDIDLPTYDFLEGLAESSVNKKIEEMFSSLKGWLEDVAEAAKPATEALQNLWNDGLAKLGEFTFGTLSDFYYDCLKPIGEWVLGEDGLARLFNILNNFLNEINFTKLRKSLDDVYKSIVPFTKFVFTGALDFLEKFLKPVAELIVNKAIPTLAGYISNLANKIKWKELNQNLAKLFEGISKFVVGIGEGLVSFFENLQPLVTSAFSGIINKIGNALGVLGDAISSIPSSTLNMVGAAIGGVLLTFKTYSTVNSIINNTGNSLANFAVKMCEIKGLNGTAGVLFDVGTGITSLAGALSVYALAIGAGVSLINFLTTVGQMAWENTDMGQLATDIENVASSLSNHNKEVERMGINKEDFESVGLAEANMVQGLIDKYYDLSSTTEDTSRNQEQLKDIVAECVKIYPDMNKYVDEQTGLFTNNKDEILKAADAMEVYAKKQALMEYLTEAYKGQFEAQKLNTEAEEAYKEAINELNELLPGLGDSIRETGDTFEYLKQASQDAASGMSDADFEEKYGVKNFDQLNVKVGDVGKSMKLLADEYQASVDNLNAKNSDLEYIWQQYDKLNGTLTGEGLDTSANNYTTLVDNIYSAIGNKLPEIQSKSTEIGTSVSTNIATGIETGQSTLTASVDKLTQAGIIDAIKNSSLATQLETEGNNAIAGFSAPFSNDALTYIAVQTWAENNVTGAAKTALDSHSPSKVFEGIGEDTVTGFNNGITTAAESTKTAITTWTENIKSWFTTDSISSTTWSTYATNIITGFNTGITSNYSTTAEKIKEWASNIKKSFTDTTGGAINATTWKKYAKDIVDGFKNSISSEYKSSLTTITAWANEVKSSFEKPNRKSLKDQFEEIGKDILRGFIKGIGNSELWAEAERKIRQFVEETIEAAEDEAGIGSPSKVFKQIGKFVIEGFNIGIAENANSSTAYMEDWMSSICDYTPALALAVDTSQLSSIPNYNSVMAADVQSSYTVGNEGFVGSIETFYREYVEPTLLSIANDTKRQADKNEQTVVKLNSRTLTQAVTDQQKANGYVFTK